MDIPSEAGVVRLGAVELNTAVAVYLKEIHGVPVSRIESVKAPVYDGIGNPCVLVTLRAK